MSSPAPLESIRYCILLALAKEPLHGGAIQSQITIDARGAGIFLQTTTIYKTLKRLQNLDLVEKSDHPHRPAYKLTPLGYRTLKSETHRLQDAVNLAKRRVPLI